MYYIKYLKVYHFFLPLNFLCPSDMVINKINFVEILFVDSFPSGLCLYKLKNIMKLNSVEVMEVGEKFGKPHEYLLIYGIHGNCLNAYNSILM